MPFQKLQMAVAQSFNTNLNINPSLSIFRIFPFCVSKISPLRLEKKSVSYGVSIHESKKA